MVVARMPWPLSVDVALHYNAATEGSACCCCRLRLRFARLIVSVASIIVILLARCCWYTKQSLPWL